MPDVVIRAVNAVVMLPKRLGRRVELDDREFKLPDPPPSDYGDEPRRRAPMIDAVAVAHWAMGTAVGLALLCAVLVMWVAYLATSKCGNA